MDLAGKYLVVWLSPGAIETFLGDLAGKYLVVWLSPGAIETFLGVLEPSHDTAMTTWTVARRLSGRPDQGCGSA